MQTLTWVAEAETRGAMEPIGRPIHNTRAYILDAALGLTPAGVPGELCLGGRAGGRGYLGQPELTGGEGLRSPIRSAPCRASRLYRTGDLARHREDGIVEYLGRIDQQVKIRGHRVELGEIEGTLAQHPAVGEAVVIAREDAPGDRRLVAYVIRAREAHLPAGLGELARYARSRMPEYMVPAAFTWCSRSFRARRGAAKVDRRALPAPDGALAVDAMGDRERYLARRTTATEELSLAAIWGERARPASASGSVPTDDFFELGGHSLLATQVVSRVRAIAGLGSRAAVRVDLSRPPTRGGASASATSSPRHAPEAGFAGRPPPLARVAAARGDAPAVVRAAAALVPRPARAGQRRVQRPPGRAPGRAARRGRARAEPRREIVRRHEALRTTFADHARRRSAAR